MLTSSEREAPPKSERNLDAVPIGSSGQIPATVTARAVERYAEAQQITDAIVVAFIKSTQG